MWQWLLRRRLGPCRRFSYQKDHSTAQFFHTRYLLGHTYQISAVMTNQSMVISITLTGAVCLGNWMTDFLQAGLWETKHQPWTECENLPWYLRETT